MAENYKVVVYGGDLPAVFAAAKASAELGITSTKKVCLIVPYPSTRYKKSDGTWTSSKLLGGIMTTGGLNYWDDRADGSGDLYTKGSYYAFKNHLGSGFNRITLSNYCKQSMTNNNVKVYYGYDIFSYTHASNPRRITSVNISPIKRNSAGRIVWSDTSSQTTLNADVFIDASTDGRLARTENSACTVGRYDWPISYLPPDERNMNNLVGRQQAATLMIKMKIPNPPLVRRCLYPGTNQVSCFWTSSNEYKTNSTIITFNNYHKDSDHIMIKPANVARDGINSDEWWVNGLLVFNVDGRAHYRDTSANTVFKVIPDFNYRTTDEAWIATKQFIINNLDEVQNAFRQLDGFGGAEIVLDNNKPIIGDVLYIRETVHMSMNTASRGHGTEDTNYQMTRDEVKNSGTSSITGNDTGNYLHRIGVGFYFCDLHPYSPTDLVNNTGYIWGINVANKMRSNDASDPQNPVYIPFEALRTNYVANLLIPGYAANISSYAWGEMRVFSNLSVLGDAAGIIAGYCCNNNLYPYNVCYDTTHMQAIQNKILAVNGRLEKS